MAASHRGTVIRHSLSALNKVLKMTEHFSIRIFLNKGVGVTLANNII